MSRDKVAYLVISPFCYQGSYIFTFLQHSDGFYIRIMLRRGLGLAFSPTVGLPGAIQSDLTA